MVKLNFALDFKTCFSYWDDIFKLVFHTYGHVCQSRLSFLNQPSPFRDGPLENLWGGGGKYKKKFAQGKIKKKKFFHAN